MPLFRVFRDTRIPNSSGIACYICTGEGIDGDWNDGWRDGSSPRIFYLCQIIAIGSTSRKAGKHSRYLQIAMRHARASVFLPSFAPGLDEIHPRPVMAHPSSIVSFTPFRETTFHSHTETLQRFPPYPSQSTSAAQFTFASFLLPPPPLFLPSTYFTPSCSDQSTGVNFILCTCIKLLKIIFNSHQKSCVS